MFTMSESVRRKGGRPNRGGGRFNRGRGGAGRGQGSSSRGRGGSSRGRGNQNQRPQGPPSETGARKGNFAAYDDDDVVLLPREVLDPGR